MNWAKAAGYRTGDNPVEGIEKGLPKQRDRDAHHSAMAFPEVPNFIQCLQDDSGQGEVARLAFEFLILTATRTSEVLGTKWSEIDRSERLWTIPETRMKAGRAHRVPLCKRALAILDRAKLLGGGSDFIFRDDLMPGLCRTWSS
ncbi:tyrosine-type recombinase/integrase [Methylocystis parvus]|uniref:tyrosine-type recombinase/integrase n=1 Tax=Methylocystis parvus TaxID=134 RepID=UPI003C7061F4